MGVGGLVRGALLNRRSPTLAQVPGEVQIPGARIIELRPGHVQRTIAQWQSLVGGNFSL